VAPTPRRKVIATGGRSLEYGSRGHGRKAQGEVRGRYGRLEWASLRAGPLPGPGTCASSSPPRRRAVALPPRAPPPFHHPPEAEKSRPGRHFLFTCAPPEIILPQVPGFTSLIYIVLCISISRSLPNERCSRCRRDVCPTQSVHEAYMTYFNMREMFALRISGSG
jgi:hypothetical protein